MSGERFKRAPVDVYRGSGEVYRGAGEVYLGAGEVYHAPVEVYRGAGEFTNKFNQISTFLHHLRNTGFVITYNPTR